MSSKSRKHSSTPARKSSGDAHAPSGGPVEGELEHAEPSAEDFLEAEELLRTPKGRNPLAYALMILLLIFLVIFFLLPPGAFSGQGGAGVNPVVARYTLPGQEPTEILYKDMIAEKRAFDGLISVMRADMRVDDLTMTRTMLMDDLAVQAGITVSEKELKEELRPLVAAYGGANQLESTMNRYGGVDALTETYRKVLRGVRYEQLSRTLLEVPSGDEVRKRWAEGNQEWAFDVVQLSRDEYLDAASAEAPSDEDISAWLAERPVFQTSQYQLPVAHAAELIGVVFDEEAPETVGEALLAAYPLAEDWDAEAQGQAYYDTYYFNRFRKPEQDKAELEEGETAPLPEKDELYFPYEEVRALSAHEAKLLSGMRAWLTEAQATLSAAETVNLSAEAERLGLAFVSVSEPLSREEWREYESGLAGPALSGQIGRLNQPEELLTNVVVDKAGIAVPRLISKREAELKPIADIRDEVLEEWAAERASELATEDLGALRESLQAVAIQAEATEEATEELDPDEQQPELPLAVAEGDFSTASAERGLTVARRDFLPRTTTADDDPNFEDPLHELMRGSHMSYTLEENQISEVQSTPAGDSVYLVRLAGKRPEPIERMTMQDYNGLLQGLDFARQLELATASPFAPEAFAERYDMWTQAEVDDAERLVEREARNARRTAARAARETAAAAAAEVETTAPDLEELGDEAGGDEAGEAETGEAGDDSGSTEEAATEGAPTDE